MRYFLNTLKKILKSKWVFLPPKKSNIIIFDQTWSMLFLNFFKKNELHILHTRGEKVNIYIILICLMRGFFSSEDYYKQYIEKVNPKIIVTFIDNSHFFWKLHGLTNIKTAFVQNGMRSHFRDIWANKKLTLKKNNYQVNSMFVFNSDYGKKYSSYIKGKVIPIGSFKSNMIKINNRKKKKEICFISTYRNMDDSQIASNDITWGYYNKNHIYFMNWLISYCKKNNLKINILGKNVGTDKFHEEQYYKNIFSNSDFNFLRPPLHGPTYKLVDKFQYVFTHDSTLGIENLSRNGRTGFISNMPNKYPINTIKFGWNENLKEKGFFWTCQNSYKEFKRVFDFVIYGSESDWKKIRKKFVRRIMPYDYNNKIFKKEIKILSYTKTH